MERICDPFTDRARTMQAGFAELDEVAELVRWGYQPGSHPLRDRAVQLDRSCSSF